MSIVYAILEIIFVAYFGSIVLITLGLFIGSKLYRQKNFRTSGKVSAYNKIAILIPAYKEDEIIIHIVQSMIELNYPNDKYDIFIIADSFEESTLQKLKDHDIRVVEVDFEDSTKAKSLNYCLSTISPNEYDLAIISDADNVMESDFLLKVNSVFNETEYNVIQAHRTAKNMNTGFSILDAMSEEVNNNLFRKGHNGLGLSSSLIGSGIVFKYDFLIQCISTINTVDEDKALQLNILEQNAFIPYFESIKTYDEKVSNHRNFQNQRRRWLSSQFKYLGDYFVKGFKLLAKGNISYFLMAVVYNFYLPRVLNLIFLFVITIIHFILPFPDTYRYLWLAILLLYSMTILFSIPRYFLQGKLIKKALLVLPKGLFSMIIILFKLKSARKEFIKTEHTAQSVDQRVNHD